MAEGELDFSNMEGMDDIDWSDVESELQQNRDMIISESSAGDSTVSDEAMDAAVEGDESTDLMSIDFLLDIPLTLTIEVGRTKLLIKDLLSLSSESIIELNKKVGEPLNVLVNDKLVAKGEVIIQNEKFGLKITEIINENERIKRLKL